MNAQEFAYWLQGFLELSDIKLLNENQVQIIKNHLNLVFNKITPDIKSGIVDQQKIFEEQQKRDKEFQELIKKMPRIDGTYCDLHKKIC